MSEDTYIANKQVSIAGGRQVGAGQIITGEFDPDAPDNALLIEEGLISASTAPVDAPEGDPGETPAAAPEGGSGDDSASQVDATEKAIELAEAESVDLAEVTGTGDGGKITVADVHAHTQGV